MAQIHDWARRIRELVAAGWDIEALPSQRAYRLRAQQRRQPRTQQVGITAKQRYRILHRDQSRCRRCGRTPADGVRLVVDHIIPRDWGGSNDDENLWTLCEDCNLGKKAWESDVDAEAMRTVLAQVSAKARLREYFKLRPSQVLRKEELQIVAGIADYQRRIRELRQDEGMNIRSNYEDDELRPGDYRFIP
ncbi:MAG: HNH endonuclease [Candidatus Rokubacteria bacterium]|nr:HNH endonuclease [Candidatus Rokubacteria bacterium]